MVSELMRRRMLMVDSLPYDAEIEYLRGTGTQYIDTNEYGNKETAMEVDFIPLKYGGTFDGVFGSRITGGNTNSISVFASASSASQRFGSQATSHAFIKDVRYRVRLDKNGIYENDITLRAWQQINDFTTPSTLKLFSVGTTGFILFNGNIYSAKIWQSGNLIFDFIPVRVGQVGYMYDKVSGQLFGNAGTGDFILGNDI